MSADNWAFCPKCKKRNDKINKDRILHARQQYGEIPADEYIALVAKVNKPIELEETMREDFEIGVYEDGVFEASYSCGCSKCDFKYTFKHTEVIIPPQ